MPSSPVLKEQKFTLFPTLPKEIRLLIWEAALPGPRTVPIRQRKLLTTIREWEAKTGRTWPVFPHEMLTMNEFARDSPPPSGAGENSKVKRFQQRVLRSQLNEFLHGDRASDRYLDAKMLGLYSPSPAPEIAGVCREALEVVEGAYPRSFAGPASFAQTWFNGARDTLYIRHDTYWVYPSESIVDINDGFPVLDVQSLRSVKRLAILWFLGAPELGRPLVEDWTAPVLRLFGGVEELVLVLRHYGDGEGEEVFLVDPKDTEEALKKYESRSAHPDGGEQVFPPMQFNFRVEELDMELLEEYRQNFGDGNPTWAMPRFVEKIAVTESVMRKLEDARRRADIDLKERGVAIAS
ncbi:hypothetical protein V8E51_003519 [Hyaloscypha variabilis]